MIDFSVLNNDEIAIFKMRSLYKKFGYSQFKMSKFEEYDLYVRNKNYLVSENVITFTDTDGKLLALKPDVTLSIIKNCEDGAGVNKVFYDENVYRVSKGTNSFKELMQVGLECIGDVDSYCIYEVMMLACESLKGISSDYVLDISHMDIISDLFNSVEIESKARKAIIKCISEKNTHGIDLICEENNIDPSFSDKLKKLVSLYGDVNTVIAEIKDIVGETDAISELEEIVSMLTENGYKIRIDFSVVSDAHYYNGFAFKGFIKGISTWILSGGQYDNLMKKMRKDAKAIGFALYLDLLERLEENAEEFDFDAVILYDENCALADVNSAVAELTERGKSVIALKELSSKIKYRQLLRLTERGVEVLENNA